VEEKRQRAVGADVSQKLHQVMKTLRIKPAAVPGAGTKAAPGGGAPVADTVVAFRFDRGQMNWEATLHRIADPSTGGVAWLFSRKTVSIVPFWYQGLAEGEKYRLAEMNPGLDPAPDTVHRQNPRITLEGFLEAGREGDFDRAAHYLDLGRIPPERQRAEGRRLARRLFLIMLRQVWVEPSLVSSEELGTPQEGVQVNQQKIAEVKIKGHEFPFLMHCHFVQKLGTVWTFAPATVGQIDYLYGALGNGWLGDRLPSTFFAVSFAGLQLWQWVCLLLILAAGWAIGRILNAIILRIAGSVSARTRVRWDDELVRALDGPLGLILWAFLVSLGSPLVGLTPTARQITGIGWNMLGLAGLGWLCFRSVDSTANAIRRLVGEKNPVGVSFLPILSRFAKALVAVFILIGALAVVGVEVVGLVAGLGIGGVAVAFAAQKTIENLFGAVSIAGDRPFAVGDYVTIDEISGTVEDIGLRSVRLRTLPRTLVTIPNAMVMSTKITNFQVRDMIMFNPTLTIAYGATSDQLGWIVDEIKRMLLADERVHPEVQRVRFKGFSPSSLDLEILCWICTTDQYVFTGIAEELNFGIMGIVERSGASFAFPTQQVYLTQAGARDAERAAAVREEVRQRRAGGTFTLPEPPPGLREKLRERPE
jgi:MscS family membrane protein